MPKDWRALSNRLALMGVGPEGRQGSCARKVLLAAL